MSKQSLTFWTEDKFTTIKELQSLYNHRRSARAEANAYIYNTLCKQEDSPQKMRMLQTYPEGLS